jgi:deoxyribodipyrimidine photo-lyase
MTRPIAFNRNSGTVPTVRVQACSDAPVRAGGRYVLYWMIAQRRLRFNYGLQRAIDWARDLRKPLLVFEPLRAGYRWASDRIHQFVIDGMRDNARSFAACNVDYYPYVEPHHGAASGLLSALAAEAAVVVTDEFPCFFLPHMVGQAANKLDVRLEQVDGNGLLPLRSVPQAYPSAFAFRRFLQKHLTDYLREFPVENALHGLALPAGSPLPANVTERWPAANLDKLRLADVQIAHDVGPACFSGGATEARACLNYFQEEHLRNYDEQHNHPDAEATSHLSPYLHFGHISAHEIFIEVMSGEGWKAADLAPTPAGKREGWWGVSRGLEAWLDQLITWRELGYNMCHRRADYDRYESLPDWARATLDEHRADERPALYDAETLEQAATLDPIWNAAQRQLVRDGFQHNYMRMLWGKKILEWSREPRQALELLIHLNNKYSVDGRDPNSYSGIFWCFGRYDRPWPERAVFGKVRSMSTASAARKLQLGSYVAKYS